MKYFFAILVLPLLTRCGDSSTSPNAGQYGPEISGQDITNRSQCVGNPQKGASIFGPGWELVQKIADGTEVTTKMYFFNESVSIFVFCSRNGISTYSQVNASAQVDETSFRILSADSRVSEATDKGITLVCKASIKTTAAVSYTFQGPCLKMFIGGEPLLLPPR